MRKSAFFRILLVTGEISGDLYGALLIKTLREINPAVQFTAIGGPRIRSLGVEVLFSAESLALVGLPTLSEAKKYLFVYKKIKEFLAKRKVDAVVLVDFPGFNLKLAKFAKKLGYPVIYFVAPQVWAWHKRRIKTIKSYVDRLYVILPFEKEFFKKHGIDAVFLGHPLIDVVKPSLSKEVFFDVYGFDTNRPLVSFFPGSREKEVNRHIPLFLKVFDRLKKDISGIQGLMVRVPGVGSPFLWEEVRRRLKVIEGSQYDVLSASDVTVLASGTVTLEAAILGTPAVVTYILPRWTLFLAKKLVKVPFISLTNLLLNEEVYPEVVVQKKKDLVIAEKVKELLENEEKVKKVKTSLQKLKNDLGTPGVTWRIAEDVIKYLINFKRVAA